MIDDVRIREHLEDGQTNEQIEVKTNELTNKSDGWTSEQTSKWIYFR